jgi:hypothetical protein
MKHCEFCDLNVAEDAWFCPRCKEYKGIMPGPVWEDNRDRADDEERADRHVPNEP